MIFGGISYEVFGEGLARVYKGIIQLGIPVRYLTQRGEKLYLQVPMLHCRRFEKLCKTYSCEFCRKELLGLLKAIHFLVNRPGLVMGFLCAAALIVYYSNVILVIDIQTEDENIRQSISSILTERGIVPGKYIPDINYVVEERALKKGIDEISWAGISRIGSGISIDIVESIPSPSGIHTGMPCHLIACENGVIEDIELYEGQLMMPLGSGVVKGDIVVSGEVMTEKSDWSSGKEIIDRRVRYVKSVGHIRGTFERVMDFYVPFESTEKTDTGRQETLYSLSFFSAAVPLFLSVPEGYYTVKEESKVPTVFGFSLPFGLERIELTEYDYKPVMIEEQQAREEAGRQAYLYEQNFLADYELRGRQAAYEITDKGVKLRVRYTLYGELCKESEFFMPKNIPKKEIELNEEK